MAGDAFQSVTDYINNTSNFLNYDKTQTTPNWNARTQNPQGSQYRPTNVFQGVLDDVRNLADWLKNQQPKTVYVGPNYKAMANATKTGAERQKDLLQQNWQTSFEAPKANLDFQTEQAEAAKNLAYQDYLTSVSNSKRLNDSAWFIGEQKHQNLRSMMNNSMNNQYGTIRDQSNYLMDVTRDINLQSLYATFNSNKHQAATEEIGKYNTINQSLDEARQNTWQQYQDLLNQARSNQSDYVNSLLAELASYYDTSVVDKNGRINDWKWINEQSGITNDGKNNYALDLQWFLGDSMTPDAFNEYLASLQNSHTPLISIPQLDFHRTLQETTDKIRGQAGRNKAEATKASNMAANQSYSTQQTKRGY